MDNHQKFIITDFEIFHFSKYFCLEKSNQKKNLKISKDLSTFVCFKNKEVNKTF